MAHITQRAWTCPTCGREHEHKSYAPYCTRAHDPARRDGIGQGRHGQQQRARDEQRRVRGESVCPACGTIHRRLSQYCSNACQQSVKYRHSIRECAVLADPSRWARMCVPHPPRPDAWAWAQDLQRSIVRLSQMGHNERC